MLIVSILIAGFILYLYFREASKKKSTSKRVYHQSKAVWGVGKENDKTDFRTEDIPKVGLFSANERKMEYRGRGKSPSGVYNDM